MSEIIYFDNSATTKISDEALKTYIDVSRDFFANPSSLHSLGFMAERELRSAKETILDTLKAKDCELIFSASGSEANNLAILGRAFSKDRYRKGCKIITTEGEHASVLEPLERLKKEGFEIKRIKTHGGKIDLEELKAELTPNVILISIMMVNNETGAIYDYKSVSALTRAMCPEALLHLDCTQSYLKIPFTFLNTGADMLTLSSHKIEGPRGAGALVVKKSVLKARGLAPLIYGGGQELGLRSGTENVAAACAFATAAKIGHGEFRKREEKLCALRDYLIEEILKNPALSHLYVTRPPCHAPHIVNITVPDIKSETMLHFLSSKNIFVSSGSACSSNSSDKSSALLAFGHTEKMADSSIRISFSHRNEKWEIDRFISVLAEGVSSLSRIKK